MNHSHLCACCNFFARSKAERPRNDTAVLVVVVADSTLPKYALTTCPPNSSMDGHGDKRFCSDSDSF